MGAPPSLPFFTPQQVPAQSGQRPDMIYPPQGTLPYRMPAIAGVAQGLDNMVQNYHNQRQAREAYFQDKVWNAIRWKMLGINSADDQTIMKWVEKAGMPVTKRNVGELQYEQQMRDYAKQQTTPFSTTPGAPAAGPPGLENLPLGVGSQALPASQMIPRPTPPAPVAPPSTFMGRLHQAIFGAPNQAYDTTMLRNLTAASGSGLLPAQAAAQLAQTQAQTHQSVAQMSDADVHTAVANQLQADLPDLMDNPLSPKNLTYERFGMIKNIGNIGDLMTLSHVVSNGRGEDWGVGENKMGRIALMHAMGVTDYNKMKMDEARAFLPYVGNNMQRAEKIANDYETQGWTNEQTTMPPEDATRLHSIFTDLTKEHPKFPSNILYHAAQAGFRGDTAAEQAILNSVSSLRVSPDNQVIYDKSNVGQWGRMARDPRDGTLFDPNTAGGQEITKQLAEEGLRAQEIDVARANANTAYGQLQAKVYENRTNSYKVVNEKYAHDYDSLQRIIDNPSTNPDDRAAAQLRQAALSKEIKDLQFHYDDGTPKGTWVNLNNPLDLAPAKNIPNRPGAVRGAGYYPFQPTYYENRPVLQPSTSGAGGDQFQQKPGQQPSGQLLQPPTSGDQPLLPGQRPTPPWQLPPSLFTGSGTDTEGMKQGIAEMLSHYSNDASRRAVYNSVYGQYYPGGSIPDDEYQKLSDYTNALYPTSTPRSYSPFAAPTPSALPTAPKQPTTKPTRSQPPTSIFQPPPPASPGALPDLPALPQSQPQP